MPRGRPLGDHEDKSLTSLSLPFLFLIVRCFSLSLNLYAISFFINIMTLSPYCSPRYWIGCFILIRWARALPRGTPGLLWPTFFGIKAHQPRWSDNRSFLPIRFSKLRCAGVQDVDDFEGKGIFFRGIVRQKAMARTCWIWWVCLYNEAFDWPSTVESSVFAKAVTSSSAFNEVVRCPRHIASDV